MAARGRGYRIEYSSAICSIVKRASIIDLLLFIQISSSFTEYQSNSCGARSRIVEP